jgi:hypothetical protein
VIRRLLQPDAELLDDPSPGRIARIAGLTALALAAYGFTTGFWRSPMMGVYVALKMPLLVACTLGCNGMLNGLLGLLLGGLGFRQSLLALLSAFAVSVRPLADTKCSAANLHGPDTHAACTECIVPLRTPSDANDRVTAPKCSPESYPWLAVQRTSAPALTSAIAVSVWPFQDARCSAVRLHRPFLQNG